jgi:hypothetical protein
MMGKGRICNGRRIFNIQCKTLLIQKERMGIAYKTNRSLSSLSSIRQKGKETQAPQPFNLNSISVPRKLPVGAGPLVVATDHTFEGSTMRKHM